MTHCCTGGRAPPGLSAGTRCKANCASLTACLTCLPNPWARRLQALKALCEARLEREDVLAHIESALQPARATARAVKRGEPPPPPLSDFRKAPLGVDSGGLVYWYLDLGHATGAQRRIELAKLRRYWPGQLQLNTCTEPGPRQQCIALTSGLKHMPASFCLVLPAYMGQDAFQHSNHHSALEGPPLPVERTFGDCQMFFPLAKWTACRS